MTGKVIVAGAFDRIGSREIRFIHEASRAGRLHVVLYEDALSGEAIGSAPEFPLAERRYFLENIRYVAGVHTIDRMERLDDIRELIGCDVDLWLYSSSERKEVIQSCAREQGIGCRVIPDEMLAGFPEHDYPPDRGSKRKVIVTGCFDWFHTGHIRFFEEASAYGDLYVILGHDENIKKLKSPDHPMFPQEERRYVAGSIRFVSGALISSGEGWMDARPEIQQLKPHTYVVNEDGHKEVKRRFCEANGIEYVVLKREPRPGLEPRSSTELRGF